MNQFTMDQGKMLKVIRSPNLTPFLITFCAALVALVLLVSAAFAVLVLAEEAPPQPSVPTSLAHYRALLGTQWLDYVPAWHEQRVQSAAVDAWQRNDWPTAIARLVDLRALRPEDKSVDVRLGAAYFLYSQQLADTDIDAALVQLQAAQTIIPDLPAVQRAYHLLNEYHLGTQSIRWGDWPTAARHLKLAQDLDNTFWDTADLLYRARYQSILQQQASGRLLQAKQGYEDLLREYPATIEIQARLGEIDRLLTPPKKRILVSIAQQRMYVYSDDQLLYNWVCSTGEPSRPTRPGHYKIQSKIPMALSGPYNLDMPYWLGIYYAGPIENGIHALPIQRSNRVKLWEGMLGTQVSFGCVILDDEHARTLFEWVTLGTPIDIVR